MRLILVFLTILSLNASAQVRPFQTTRLVSTSGAGVGSVLVNESAILNPASLAFFSGTYVSYQNTRSELRSENPQREVQGQSFSRSNRNEGYFIFDNSTPVKGGFSYQYQNENGIQRRRTTATLAAALGTSLTAGLLYKYTEDTGPIGSTKRHRVAHPLTLGLTWIAMPKLTLGVIWSDPGQAVPGESEAVLGSQFSITERLIVMFDAGSDPTRRYSDTMAWKGAVQYNPLGDLFLRLSRFSDKAQNLEGEAWGVSWTGPKLGLDFAVKTSHQLEDKSSFLFRREKMNEYSFAANLRF
ncbi:MAG: hypothetical protein ACLGG7_06470 [Bacteriovoracia bacterium]